MQTKTKTRYRTSARTQSRTDILTGARTEPCTQPHHTGPSGPRGNWVTQAQPPHRSQGEKGILSVCLTEATGWLRYRVVIAVQVWRGVTPGSVTGVFYTKPTPMCTLWEWDSTFLSIFCRFLDVMLHFTVIKFKMLVTDRLHPRRWSESGGLVTISLWGRHAMYRRAGHWTQGTAAQGSQAAGGPSPGTEHTTSHCNCGQSGNENLIN